MFVQIRQGRVCVHLEVERGKRRRKLSKHVAKTTPISGSPRMQVVFREIVFDQQCFVSQLEWFSCTLLDCCSISGACVCVCVCVCVCCVQHALSGPCSTNGPCTNPSWTQVTLLRLGWATHQVRECCGPSLQKWQARKGQRLTAFRRRNGGIAHTGCQTPLQGGSAVQT